MRAGIPASNRTPVGGGATIEPFGVGVAAAKRVGSGEQARARRGRGLVIMGGFRR